MTSHGGYEAVRNPQSAACDVIRKARRAERFSWFVAGFALATFLSTVAWELLYVYA